MKSKLNSKKGFTLIELIVVIAILGILVLLAAPRFLGYTQKADEVKIQNDVKVVGNKIIGELSKDDTLLGGELIESDKLIALADEGKLYDYKGQVSELDEKKLEEHYKVSEEIIKDSGTNLEGEFYSSSKGNTYYEHTKSAEKDEDIVVDPVVDPNEGVYLATDEDFSGTEDGKFKYIGKELEVRIPHVIKGVNVTSYVDMFKGSRVTKVVSDNSEITDVAFMFYGSQASSLDFSDFDTSNVTRMGAFLAYSNATSINLSGFDTSKVTNMGSMFQDTQLISIDVSSFNTSNVTHMASMFSRTKATSIDLSSFNTSKVTSTAYMFTGAKITSGYARTQSDANEFNSSLGKPLNLTFVVKP